MIKNTTKNNPVKNEDGTIKVYSRAEIATAARTFIVAKKQDKVAKALELCMLGILDGAQEGKFSCESPKFSPENEDVAHVIGSHLQELGFNVELKKEAGPLSFIIAWGIYK